MKTVSKNRNAFLFICIFYASNSWAEYGTYQSDNVHVVAYTHRKDCFTLQDGTARLSQKVGN
jgi:hypothetical protein